MTGVELSIEQRAKWRKDAEDDLRMMISQLGARACRQILTLLDALEAAEARVEPVEKMARDANRAAIEYLNRAEAAEDENRRLTALVEAGLGLADEWQAVYDRWANLHPAFAAVSAGDRFGIFRAHAIRLRDALGGAK